MLGTKRFRFLLTGGLNALFGFSIFVFYEYVFGDRVGYMWTLLLAHVTSVLFAYTTHRRFVFRVTGSVLRDLWKFESVYLVALSVNAMLLPVAVEVLGLPVIVAQAAITAVNALVSWFGHSRFTFARRTAVRDDADSRCSGPALQGRSGT